MVFAGIECGAPIIFRITGAPLTLAGSSEDCRADGFKIEQSSDGEAFTEVATVDAKAGSYTASGPGRGKTYYYHVCPSSPQRGQAPGKSSRSALKQLTSPLASTNWIFATLASCCWLR
jgi:hypothetical protein